MRMLLSALALLLLLVPAVRAEEFTARSDALGPLKLGMSGPQVVKALGKPAKQGPWIEEAATGLQVQDWHYPKRGLELTMSREKPGGPLSLERLRASAGCDLATARGIKIGDSADKVKKAYGSAIDSATPESIVAGSLYDGVIFSLQKGRVTGIFFGAAAE